MKKQAIFAISGLAVLAGCATYVAPTKEEAIQTVKSSFKERGPAKLDRLNQTEIQAVCSDAQMTRKEVPKAQREALEKKILASIKYPADGKFLGDYKQGERIAQSGVGLQWSDGPTTVNGGNCYACHQLTKAEVSYGTIGPSLYNFAKLRGYGEQIQRYAWGKVYNSQAFSACSSMPRFGHSQILTEQQIKDVVALLMSPDSPVNK